MLARLIRARLESLIPAAYSRLAALAGKFRDAVKRRLTADQARRAFWKRVFLGRVAELVFSGREKAAEVALARELAAKANLTAPTLIIVGEVVRLREKLKWFEAG